MVVIPNASESAIAELERFRNKAVRVQTVCVKSSQIVRFRNLVGMPNMKEIATVQAATLRRLYEKAMISTRSSATPLKFAIEDHSTV